MHKKNVLFIGDKAFTITSLLLDFAKKKYNLVVLSSPKIAPSLIHVDGIDVVVIELSTAHNDEVDIIRQLRSNGFAGKVMLISAPSFPSRTDPDKLSADAFFEKPFSMDDLFRKVTEWTM